MTSDAFSDEQLEAIRARAPLVTVSAGAGSGKTTVLVERFIDLVQRDGVSPLEILAITFTEKAAAEMKERIVRRFEERGDVANRRLAEAAYISTIHGFCSRILREHPLAARLDPSFRVMDEVTRNVFLDEYLEQLYKDDWYVETEPLITEAVRVGPAAALRADRGGRVPAWRVRHRRGDRGEPDGRGARRRGRATRTRAYWDDQWATAREQLLECRSARSRRHGQRREEPGIARRHLRSHRSTPHATPQPRSALGRVCFATTRASRAA